MAKSAIYAKPPLIALPNDIRPVPMGLTFGGLAG
jgi:hypothetical protein